MPLAMVADGPTTFSQVPRQARKSFNSGLEMAIVSDNRRQLPEACSTFRGPFRKAPGKLTRRRANAPEKQLSHRQFVFLLDSLSAII